MPTYPDGFPRDVIDAFVEAHRPRRDRQRAGVGHRDHPGARRRAGARPASGSSTRRPTRSSRSRRTSDVVPLEELYAACQIAREILTGPHAVGRVIARPVRRQLRLLRAHAEPPRLLARAGRARTTSTRIREAGSTGARRWARSPTSSPAATSTRRRRRGRTPRASSRPSGCCRRSTTGLIFTNLVETDSMYGHRNDPEGFHRCLQEFDRELPQIRAALRADDLLILCSDHGCDPTTDSTDHSREHALLVAHSPSRAHRGRGPPRRRVLRRRRDRPDLADGRGARPGRGRVADPVPVRAAELIARSATAASHTPTEIRFLVDGFLDGSVAPEQMSAWCMAVVWRGLDDAEIDALCAAMVESGDVVDLSALGRTVVDKHSTGGVGDKVTIALAPLVAACGVPVAKMSGRGLGHTGGTLDKLEAIPGYRIEIAIPEFVRLVGEVGLRGGRADQRARARRRRHVRAARRHRHGAGTRPDRDVGDVEEARLRRRRDGARREGRRRRVLPHGRGGARAGAADVRPRHARRAGGWSARSRAWTRRSGSAVGNALEVAEAFDVLRGTAPADVTEVVHTSAARLLVLADPALSDGRGRRARARGDRVGRGRSPRRAGGSPHRAATRGWSTSRGPSWSARR